MHALTELASALWKMTDCASTCTVVARSATVRSLHTPTADAAVVRMLMAVWPLVEASMAGLVDPSSVPTHVLSVIRAAHLAAWLPADVTPTLNALLQDEKSIAGVVVVGSVLCWCERVRERGKAQRGGRRGGRRCGGRCRGRGGCRGCAAA